MNGSIKVEGVVVGLCLVALGTLWLLSNLGRLEMFPILRTWWPLALVVWGLAYWRGSRGTLLRALSAVCLLLAAQGIVGLVQYYNALPAEVVWIHASLPAVLWVALVWSWLAAAPAPARQPTPPAAQPEPALVR